MSRKAVRRHAVMFISVLGLASAAIPLGATTARADDNTSIISFTSAVEAPTFQVSEDEPSAATHPEGEGELVHTMATLDSTAGYGLAAPFWPGAEAANAGGLLVLLGAPSQVGALNDPVNAQARTGTGPPSASLTAAGASMTASATNAKVTADTAMSKVTQAGLSFGAATSHSQLTYDGKALAANASSSAENVSIDGGVVTIQSASSTAQGTTDGSAPPKVKGSTVFSGMKVGGVPVAIDDTGFHVGSGPASNPVPMQQIDQALSGAGMKMFYVAPHTVTVGERAFYYAASLLVYWAPPGDKSDNSFTVSLGGAAINLGASRGTQGGLLGGTAAPLGDSSTPSEPTPGPVVSSLPAEANLPASAAADLSQPSTVAIKAPAQVAQGPAELAGVRHATGPTGVAAGWIVLLILGAIAGAIVLPKLPAALRAAAVPVCAHERRRPTRRS